MVSSVIHFVLLGVMVFNAMAASQPVGEYHGAFYLGNGMLGIVCGEDQ